MRLMLCLFVVAILPASAEAQMTVGTNLSGCRDWGTSQFHDVLNQQRTWITRNADQSGDWGSGYEEEIPVGANGWPSQVPFSPAGAPPQIVHTVFPIRGNGTWQLNVEGTGIIRIRGGGWFATQTINIAGQASHSIEVQNPGEEFRGTGLLEILESDAADPVRNLSFVAPADQATSSSLPFYESYLDRMDSFGLLRFMDLGATNNNPVVSWSDRTTLDSFTQTRPEGVSIEHLVGLANMKRKAAWFCVPARADDNYVRNMAAYIRDNLDADLKCYVEYSNETWNSIFDQTTWVQDQGQALGLGTDRWGSGQLYCTFRSVEIWEIFEDEFGGDADDRLIKVMATQSANPSLSEARMDALDDPVINPHGTRPDVLAIAPYFGGVADEIVANNEVATISIAEILDRMQADIASSASHVEAHKLLAEKYDTFLVTYESGQHLVGTAGNENIDELTEKLIATNRDSRMEDLYLQYLDMLNAEGVSVNVNFSFIDNPSKWGSWGILEDQEQPTVDAPKFAAIRNWIANNPPANLAPVARFADVKGLIDIDDDGTESISLDSSGSRDLDGTVVSQTWLVDGEVVSDSVSIDIDLAIGQHEVELIIIDSGGATGSSVTTVTVSPNSANQVLVESDFTGSAPGSNTPWASVSQIDDNTNFSGWNLAAGLNAVALDDVLGFSGLFNGTPLTLAESLAGDDYLSFSVEPQEGFSLDLRGAKFSFTIERPGYHASRRFHVFSSVGGFNMGDQIFDSELTTSQEPQTMVLVLPFDGYLANAPIEFRVYVSGGQWSFHETSLNEFSLFGSSVDPSSSLGDTNQDGVVDFSDISSFISILSAGNYVAEADTNGDGVIDFFDISLFISLLAS